MLLGFPSLARWMPQAGRFAIANCNHHQAVEARLANIGCLAWIRTKTVGVKTRYAACYTTRQEMVEPEVVATSPRRIKSPVPVCCGFDSMKREQQRKTAPPR